MPAAEPTIDVNLLVDVNLLPARPPMPGEFGPVPPLDQIQVGDLVVAYSRGAERVAMVEKVGRSNVSVIYTTKGAWDTASKTYEAILSRNAASTARYAEDEARRNHAFYIQEANPATARYPEYRSDDDLVRITEVAATPVEEYVAAEVAEALKRLAADQAHAREIGVEGHVNITRKSVKHADVIGWRAV